MQDRVLEASYGVLTIMPLRGKNVTVDL